jgi:hypothetical protein
VEVDGIRTPALRINAVSQGVILPAGPHHVRFRYAPAGLGAGAALSALGLCGLVIGAVETTLRHRRRR